MIETIELKGISWDHPRGHDPMVATADAFMRDYPEVRITWHTRSLQDFGDYPIERLADRYDLLLVDHPFAGTAAQLGCLLPVDLYLDDDFLADQAANSVGPSYGSYDYGGHLWALPIDAAGQVSACRPDLLAELDVDVPISWDGVLALAESTQHRARGRVAIPLVPTDAVLAAFSVCANAGAPPFTSPEQVVDPAVGRHALDLLRRLVTLAHPESREWNPIRTLDRMSTTDEVAYVPLLFGYSNYSRPGFRRHLIRFVDVPRASDGVPRGATLGGVGLAVSATTRNPEAAFTYARFVVDPVTQRTLFFASGGQPGHRTAWLDPEVNAASGNFFLDTLQTLDHAYLRPRHPGYATFQERAGEVVQACLVGNLEVEETFDLLNRLYQQVVVIPGCLRGTGPGGDRIPILRRGGG